MQRNPKIIVLNAREILYTLLLLFFLTLLILCLVLMFSGFPKKQAQSLSSKATQTEETAAQPSDPRYTPGVYTTPLVLGDTSVDVEVTVDQNHINAIRLVNLSETAAASFPLVSPSLDHIAAQILEQQNLNDITAPSGNRYTSQLLLSAIADALTLASVS